MLIDSMHHALQGMTRRQVIGGGAASLSLAAMAGAGSALAASAQPAPARFDFTKPADNLYAWAKTWGTLGDEPVYGGHEGTFFAVVGQQRAIPLVGYVGFGSLQFKVLPDGSLRYRGKDATYYTDLATGKIIDEWRNPFTGENCKVHPYINARVRTTMPTAYPSEAFSTDHYGWQISIGHATRKDERGKAYHGDRGSGERRPFVLPWKRVGDYYMLGWDWALEVVNPVTPEGWPDSSTGAVINPSEHFVFFVPAQELEDRSRPWATMLAGFFRQTPWLPWMKMGRSAIQGVMFARSHSYKVTGGVDNIPAVVRERLERDHPDMLQAPTDWEDGPIGSTWGYYASVVPPENPLYRKQDPKEKP